MFRAASASAALSLSPFQLSGRRRRMSPSTVKITARGSGCLCESTHCAVVGLSPTSQAKPSQEYSHPFEENCWQCKGETDPQTPSHVDQWLERHAADRAAGGTPSLAIRR